MKYVSMISSAPSSASVEFFAERDFKGEVFKIKRGVAEFAGFKSFKLSDFTSVTFYENSDGSGKSTSFIESSADFALSFTPALVSVESYVKCFKDGKNAGVLTCGEYSPTEIKKFDKISVPRGLYLAFVQNKRDENTVSLFENQEYAVDGRVDEYGKAIVFSLGSEDIRINFRGNADLDDDELLAVVGGICGKNLSACAAKACAVADNG